MVDALGYFAGRVEEAATLQKSQTAALSTLCAAELMPGIQCGRAGLYTWTSRVFCPECPKTGGRYCAEHAERQATHVRAHLAEAEPVKVKQRPRAMVGSRVRAWESDYRQERKAKRKVAAAARRANKRRSA